MTLSEVVNTIQLRIKVSKLSWTKSHKTLIFLEVYYTNTTNSKIIICCMMRCKQNHLEATVEHSLKTAKRNSLSSAHTHGQWFSRLTMAFVHTNKRERRGKRQEDYLYSAILVCLTHKVLRHGSHSFTCKLHQACLSVVSVHQMAPLLTDVACIQLQVTTHLSTSKGWKAELA